MSEQEEQKIRALVVMVFAGLSMAGNAANQQRESAASAAFEDGVALYEEAKKRGYVDVFAGELPL